MGNEEDLDLARGEPEGKSTGFAVFEQQRQKTLETPEGGSVDHHRRAPRGGVCTRRGVLRARLVLQSEPLRELEIELDRTALVVPS